MFEGAPLALLLGFVARAAAIALRGWLGNSTVVWGVFTAGDALLVVGFLDASRRTRGIARAAAALAVASIAVRFAANEIAVQLIVADASRAPALAHYRDALQLMQSIMSWTWGLPMSAGAVALALAAGRRHARLAAAAIGLSIIAYPLPPLFDGTRALYDAIGAEGVLALELVQAALITMLAVDALRGRPRPAPRRRTLEVAAVALFLHAVIAALWLARLRTAGNFVLEVATLVLVALAIVWALPRLAAWPALLAVGAAVWAADVVGSLEDLASPPWLGDHGAAAIALVAAAAAVPIGGRAVVGLAVASGALAIASVVVADPAQHACLVGAALCAAAALGTAARKLARDRPPSTAEVFA